MEINTSGVSGGKRYAQAVSLILAVARNLCSIILVPDFEIWVVPKRRVHEYTKDKARARMVREFIQSEITDETCSFTEEDLKKLMEYLNERKK